MADRNPFELLGERQDQVDPAQNQPNQPNQAAGATNAENANPNVSTQDATQAQMAHTIAQLQQRLAQLDVQAAAAVMELQAQVQLAQGNATAAAHLSQRPPMAPVRIPQLPKFKGVHDGPKILEWTHIASTYLRAAGLENEETGVWHITNFLEAGATVWWRLYCDKIERNLEPEPARWSQLRALMIAQFQIFNHVIDVRDKYTALQ